MSHQAHAHCLEIVADSDPTLLSRVCGVLANLGIIPDRLLSTLDADDGTLRVAIFVSRWTARQTDLAERKLSQLPCVHMVSSTIGEPADSQG